MAAKTKTSFVCNECGTLYSKWMGKCDACGAWNSLTEEKQVSVTGKLTGKGQTAELISLDAEISDKPRLDTGLSEFNRVLGGGLVVGSAILIGGDPGIGKSTILMQATAQLSVHHKVLYFSGEESASQIQLRAKRLGHADKKVQIATTGELESIIATIKKERPALVVIDSIQTIFSNQLDSAPGTVSQVRVAAHELIQTAKTTGSALIFVGHVTKDGQIAGPRVLEHMVDTVLYFEGERGGSFRVLRTFKNRFGATNEIGVFEMKDVGLEEVTNPSALFLSERPEGAPGSAVTSCMEGTRPVLVEIQALVSNSNMAQPRRTTLGFDHNRLSMMAAVLDKQAGFTFSSQDIFVNITGGLKVEETAADLALAGALISSLLNKPLEEDRILIGEIGLAGEVRSVSQMEVRLKEAEKLGFKSAVVPKQVAKESKTKLKLIPIERLSEITEKLYD